MTTMTSELSKYLNVQVVVFLNMKQLNGFLSKNIFIYNVIFCQKLCYLRF